jgi:hypothetical protein
MNVTTKSLSLSEARLQYVRINDVCFTLKQSYVYIKHNKQIQLKTERKNQMQPGNKY